jgi:DNA-binding NarL/FixJ family response regulator
MRSNQSPNIGGHLACCNYAHIYWGTRKQNKADEVTHGVINRGERQGHAKLTEQQVVEIRRLTGGMIQKDIAAKFGVSASTIRMIQKGKNWAWLK